MWWERVGMNLSVIAWLPQPHRHRCCMHIATNDATPLMKLSPIFPKSCQGWITCPKNCWTNSLKWDIVHLDESCRISAIFCRGSWSSWSLLEWEKGEVIEQLLKVYLSLKFLLVLLLRGISCKMFQGEIVIAYLPTYPSRIFMTKMPKFLHTKTITHNREEGQIGICNLCI